MGANIENIEDVKSQAGPLLSDEIIKIMKQLNVPNGLSAIGFNLSSKVEILETSNFDMVYTIEENIWNGKSTIQLNIKDIK